MELPLNIPYAVALLSKHCGECHGTQGFLGGQCAPGASLCNIDDIDAMVESGRIVIGDPEASSIYQSITSGEMPPPGACSGLNEQEVELLGTWIQRLRLP